MEITKPYLKKLCRDNDGYGVPELNDKLYLHYKGFRCIQNLDEYINLKVIWLEGNGLGKIEGLEELKELRTLYLHENIIDKIQNLESQIFLDTLNLSKNYVGKIENLSHMTMLKTLILSNNNLKTADDIRHVLEVPSLETLDIQHNKIDDVGIVDVVTTMPNLRVLYLQGNPVVKDVRHYRKSLVSGCRELRYLDDRPVFEDERRRTDAWARGFRAGGTLDAANAAEREEIRRVREEKRCAEERNFLAMEQMMREGAELRLMRGEEERQRAEEQAACAAAGLPSPPRASALPPGPGDVNPFSGERILQVDDSPAVRRYREEQVRRLLARPPPDPDALLRPPPPAAADLPPPPPPPPPPAAAAAPCCRPPRPPPPPGPGHIEIAEQVGSPPLPPTEAEQLAQVLAESSVAQEGIDGGAEETKGAGDTEDYELEEREAAGGLLDVQAEWAAMDAAIAGASDIKEQAPLPPPPPPPMQGGEAAPGIIIEQQIESMAIHEEPKRGNSSSCQEEKEGQKKSSSILQVGEEQVVGEESTEVVFENATDFEELD